MKIIYKILYGSDVYGTTTNDSDKDLRGIYLPTIDECLSLVELKDIRKETKDKKGNTIEDLVVYPIQKFFRLAIKSNPAVFEWLFVPNWAILEMTEAGKMIRNARLMFLSQELYPRFKGFALSEFSSMTKLTGETGDKRKKKILEFGYDPKNAMNVIRLMEQGIELLETANLIMPRPNAQELIKIKKGEKTYQDIVKMFNELETKLDEAKAKTRLPKEPRFEDANDLMIKIIKNFGG